MATISNCPECQQQVTLPENSTPQARVLCPLCQAEYPLEEILKSLPPQLVLLDPPTTSEPTSAWMAEEDEEDSAEVAATGEDSRGEASGGEEPDSEQPDDPWGAAFGAEEFKADETADDFRANESEEESEEIEAEAFGEDDFSGDDFRADESEDEIELEPFETANEGQSLDFGDSEPNFDAERPGPAGIHGIPTIAPLPNRRRRPSALRQMIGVAGGGVMGLSLGYFILLWIGGPQKDFLKVGHKLPALIVPAAFHQAVDDRPINDGGSTAQFEPSDFDELAQKFSDFATENEPSPPETFEPAADASAAPPVSEFALDDETLPAVTEPEMAAPEMAEPQPLADAEAGNSIVNPATAEIENFAPEEFSLPLDNAALAEPAAAMPEETPAAAMPEPETEPQPAVQVQLRNAPRFGTDELKTSLAEVEQQHQGLLTGSLEDAAAKRGKIAGFRAYCELGHVYTFADAANAGEELQAAETSIRQRLVEIAGQEQAMADIGNLSALWVTSEKRPKPGVLLAGMVLEVKQQGEAHAVVLVPLGSEQPVKVVTAEQPNVEQGSRAVVLGSIVDHPEEIAGYQVTMENQMLSDDLEGEAGASKVIFSRMIVTADNAAL